MDRFAHAQSISTADAHVNSRLDAQVRTKRENAGVEPGARKRRPLSPEQKADARRLRRAWDARRADLGITSQPDMALRCGWSTQSAFGQYVAGHIPLNLRALTRISQALRIEPELISPTLARDLPAGAREPPEPMPLSPREQRPLSAFRVLTPPQQARVLQLVEEIDGHEAEA